MGGGLSWGGAFLAAPGAKRRANNIQVLLVRKEGSASEEKRDSQGRPSVEAERIQTHAETFCLAYYPSNIFIILTP